LANGGNVWCKIPERYIERSSETGRIRRNAYSWCLIREDRPFDGSGVYGGKGMITTTVMVTTVIVTTAMARMAAGVMAGVVLLWWLEGGPWG
jgi:hypothetical protein